LAAAGSGAAGEIDPDLADFDRVVIRLYWEGEQPGWEINRRPIASLTELRDRLEAIASLQTSSPLVIDAEADVPLGHVIDVYDIARIQGFSQVQFAAQ
jgi:biopolymer transport protein ExbD